MGADNVKTWDKVYEAVSRAHKLGRKAGLSDEEIDKVAIAEGRRVFNAEKAKMNEEDDGYSWGPTLAMLVTGVLIGVLVGRYAATSGMRKEAVEHGAATWKVDSGGNVEFEWKTPAKEGK